MLYVESGTLFSFESSDDPAEAAEWHAQRVIQLKGAKLGRVIIVKRSPAGRTMKKFETRNFIEELHRTKWHGLVFSVRPDGTLDFSKFKVRGSDHSARQGLFLIGTRMAKVRDGRS